MNSTDVTKKLVSVIIPVYNGANYMRDAIESVLAQTYTNIEILVINDGSNDQTREIALSYGDKIRYFEKENGGVSSALNMGIRNMRGEYFSWLSHDDIYYPEKIAENLNALSKVEDKTIPAYSGFSFLRMSDKKIWRYESDESRYPGAYFEEGLTSVLLGFISGCSLLIHKSLFDNFGLFDEADRTTQDYRKWYELFCHRKLIYINKSLVVSRIHGDQVEAKTPGYLEQCDKLYSWIVQRVLEDTLLSDKEKRNFLNMALIRFGNCGFDISYNAVLEALKKGTTTVEDENLRSCFSSFLEKTFGKKIYLYCMGKRGRTLLHALYMRDICVEGYSDSDDNLCVGDFFGIKGVDLKSIPKDASIIITKENPEELRPYFLERGFEKIYTYYEIERKLMETPVNYNKLNN